MNLSISERRSSDKPAPAGNLNDPKVLKQPVVMLDGLTKSYGKHRGIKIGYGINDEYQSRGYAAEAVNAAVIWALQQPGVTRVEAETEPDNSASQRVLKKCGFVPSGFDGEERPRFIRNL